MNRPTKEQVDHFVERAKSREEAIGDEWIEGGAFEAEIVLAAEVVALREDNARLNRELEMHASRGLDRSYAYAIGQIESVLRVPGAPPLRETVEAVSKLRAKLARVEALAENWRSIVADADRFQLHVSPLLYEVAAAELEAALRGDP